MSKRAKRAIAIYAIALTVVAVLSGSPEPRDDTNAAPAYRLPPAVQMQPTPVSSATPSLTESR